MLKKELIEYVKLLENKIDLKEKEIKELVNRPDSRRSCKIKDRILHPELYEFSMSRPMVNWNFERELRVNS